MPVLGSVGAEKRPVQSMPSRTLNLEETGTVMIVRHPSKVLRGYGGGVGGGNNIQNRITFQKSFGCTSI